MHSLATVSRPRLSETEPNKLFAFETSCSMRSVCAIALNAPLRKINMNTVKNGLLYRINSTWKLLLSMYTLIILTMCLFAQRNS